MTGGVLHKIGGFIGQGRGGMHIRHRMFKQGSEYLGRDWSGGRGGSPLLEGGLGGPPPRNFVKILHEMVRSGSITLIICKSLNGYNFATVCPIFKIQKV